MWAAQDKNPTRYDDVDRPRVKAEIAAVDLADAKTSESCCRFLRRWYHEKFWNFPTTRPAGRLAAVTVSRRNVLNVFARVSVYHATISYIIATELLFQYFFFFFLIGFSSPKLVIFFARFCTN